MDERTVELILLRRGPRSAAEAHRVGTLRVRYSADRERVEEVHLHLPEGITPTALRRFAWERWLGLALATLRLPVEGAAEVMSTGERFREWWWGRNPGRRGHPREHYQRVAAEYASLVAEGERAPTEAIARRYKVPRNTAAGWVHRARVLGYLPEGREGRIG